MNTITRTLAGLDPEAGASTELTTHDEDLLRTIMATPIAQPARKQHTHVRRTVIIGGLVAATVALGLIKIDIGGHEVGASPAAAEVLERAADAALEGPNPVVKPGQYLRITLVEDSWAAFYDKNAGKANSIAIGSDGKPVVYHERRTRQMWIPHDVNDPWMIRDGSKPLRNVSKDSIPYNVGEEERTWSNPSWADKANRKSYINTYDPAWYATLPRDPQKLLARLASEGKGDGSSANFLFQEVFSEVLRSGIAPADIRATLFKALAERPEMKVVNGVTNLDGRRGVALQFRGSTWQMLFDRDTGAYIGERATDRDFPDVPGLDADKTTWLSTVKTDVVDSAPKPD
jgi:hypothetical protein